MKRFESLEFGDKDPRKKKVPLGEPIRDAGFFSHRAQQHWLAAEFEKALLDYSRALEKSNTFYPAWKGQVYMLIELNEYPEAIVWADKALALFPEHPELMAAKAVAFTRDAKMDKALAYSDNAMSKENVSAWVWLSRAEVMMTRKNKTAESCISKAISQAGNDAPFIRLEAGGLLLRFKKYILALENLQEAVKMLPKSARAWYSLGCCQARLGFSEASTSLQQCLHLRPSWRLAEIALNKHEKRGILKRISGRIFRK